MRHLQIWTHIGALSGIQLNSRRRRQSTPAFGLPAATKLRPKVCYVLFQKPSRRLHVSERQIGATMGVSSLRGWVRQPSNVAVQLEIAKGSIS